MTIRNIVLAVATAASVAVPTVSAQAGQDERRFAYGVAAGIAGAAIIGGIAANANRAQPRYVEPLAYAPRGYSRVRVSNVDAHIGYCEGRYRTYDAVTNTFQPNHGQRRQCVSPYSR